VYAFTVGQEKVEVAALALSGDESLLVVRVSHSVAAQLLFTDEFFPSVIECEFLVVDVVSAQLVGSVGSPLRGVSPPAAEFLADTNWLLVTVHVDPRQVAAAKAGQMISILIVKRIPSPYCC